MYNVSQAYLNQIKKEYVRRALRGTIGNVSFTHSDILSGSFSLSNQCSEPNEVKIGTVNVGELQITFRNGLINRDHWKGQIISVSEGIWIDSRNEYEYVPLGVFTVDDSTYDKDGVKVTAYDNMLKFDKAWNLSTTIGSPFSILRMLCSDCRVGLGMTEAEIEALPNGTQQIALYSENDCETYRDVLFWLAQLLGTFATIDRTGKLVLRAYGDTVIDSVSAGLRFDDNEFSDFETEYSGIAYTDIDSDEYVYISGEEDDKLTYNLGANPFIQYGTKSTKKSICINILNELRKIKFVPFKTSMLNTPAYDLGDVIVFTDGIADGNKKSCIMFYEYNNSYYSAEGFGANPALATARNKVDKNISGLKSRVDKNSIQFYTFKNAEEIVVGEGQTKRLIYIRFTSMDAKQVTFQAEILADADVAITDIEANIKYQLDGALVVDYQPTETWSEDGKHIISLYYVIDVEPNTLYRWEVLLNSVGGSITIPIENARGTIWGQGLVAVDKWDGYIDLDDKFAPIPLRRIGLAPFTDSMTIDAQPPIEIEFEEEFASIDISRRIGLAPFTDYVYINKTSIYYERLGWDDLYEMDWGEVLDNHLW